MIGPPAPRPPPHVVAIALFALAFAESGAASVRDPIGDVVAIDAPALAGAWLVPADPARAADPPRNHHSRTRPQAATSASETARVRCAICRSTAA